MSQPGAAVGGGPGLWMASVREPGNFFGVAPEDTHARPPFRSSADRPY
jgi:hypothetical protein